MGRIGLLKTLEDKWQKLRINSFAGIGNLEKRTAVNTFQADMNVPPLRRELQSIRQKVPYDLVKTRRVNLHWPDTVVEIACELNALGLHAWEQRIYGLSY